jgi:hypothetical protein
MTAGDIAHICLELGRRAGVAPHTPRFLAAEAVDRLLVPLMEDAISPQLRRLFGELLEMTWLFQSPGAMPTSLPELGFGAEVSRAALRTAFTRSMDFWAEATGLVSEQAALEEEIAS